MSIHAAPPRSVDLPGRTLAVLGALAAAFGAAFVFAPAALAASAPGGGFAGQRAIVDALRTAFIEYWNSGGRPFPPDLARLVDYWFRYHVAKAVMSACLLTVLVALGVLLWRAFLRAGGLGTGKRTALASAWVLVTALAVGAAAAVAANIQGAVAPFASLISMLPAGEPDRQLTDTVGQIRRQLTDYQSTNGRTAPPLEAMISDYTLYHAVMVVLASLVTLLLIGMSAASWRRFARADSSNKHSRRALAAFGGLSILLALAVAVVLAANANTTADPIPGLSSFFTSGW